MYARCPPPVPIHTVLHPNQGWAFSFKYSVQTIVTPSTAILSLLILQCLDITVSRITIFFRRIAIFSSLPDLGLAGRWYLVAVEEIVGWKCSSKGRASDSVAIVTLLLLPLFSCGFQCLQGNIVPCQRSSLTSFRYIGVSPGCLHIVWSASGTLPQLAEYLSPCMQHCLHFED